MLPLPSSSASDLVGDSTFVYYLLIEGYFFHYRIQDGFEDNLSMTYYKFLSDSLEASPSSN